MPGGNYELGEWVPEGYADADRWLRKGEEEGVSEAQFYLVGV